MTKETIQSTAASGMLEDWTPEEVRLIQETVARGATDEELQLFLYTAKARGLNPLLKQIYFIKRKQKRGDRWVDVGVIQTGVDGFRLIANRTKKLRGIERGIKRDENGKLYAWARVWRKEWENPAYEEVSLEEYKGETPLWHRMPEQMLKKCAEVAALRMAFPEDLSGLYSHEEMDQADKPDIPVMVAPPQKAEAPVKEGADSGKAETPKESETEARQLKQVQVAMRDALAAITRLQKEHKLDKETIQEVTGLETFKGADLSTLQQAVADLEAYCTEEKALQKV